MTRFVPAALVLALVAPLSAQEAPKVVPFQGSHAFRHILHYFRLEPLDGPEALDRVRADETLLVVFGDPAPLDRIGGGPGGLRMFQNGGGAVLIATDRPTDRRLAPWSARIPGSAVLENGPNAYQGIPNCPWVPVADDDRHPLLQGLRRGLATNGPSFFDRHGRGPEVLGRFSDDCRPQRGTWPVARAPYVLAGGADAPPAGRFVLVAGHGVFMNGMMARKDNDNFDFAWNCVRWLRERPDRPRKHVLFLEEGEAVTEFEVPLAEVPPLPTPTVRVLNHLIRGLEREGLPNRVVHGLFSREQILRGVLVVVTLWLVGLAAWRLLHTRHGPDTAVPLLVSAPATHEAEGTALAQRGEAALSGDNLGESARALARHFLEVNAGLPAPTAETAGAAALPFQVRASWRRQGRATRQLRAVWELAYRDPPGPVTRADFHRLVGLLDELTSALADGTLQLTEGPRPA